MTASGKFLIITHFLSCGKKSDTLICTKNSDFSTYICTYSLTHSLKNKHLYFFIWTGVICIQKQKISGKSIFCKSKVQIFHDISNLKKQLCLTKHRNLVKVSGFLFFSGLRVIIKQNLWEIKRHWPFLYNFLHSFHCTLLYDFDFFPEIRTFQYLFFFVIWFFFGNPLTFLVEL